MPQVTASFSEKRIEEIKKVSMETNRSFSNTIDYLVDFGLQVYKGINEKAPTEDKKSKNKLQYTIETFGMISDIYRCVYDKKKSLHGADDADEAIKKIQQITKDFLKTE